MKSPFSAEEQIQHRREQRARQKARKNRRCVGMVPRTYEEISEEMTEEEAWNRWFSYWYDCCEKEYRGQFMQNFADWWRQWPQSRAKYDPRTDRMFSEEDFHRHFHWWGTAAERTRYYHDRMVALETVNAAALERLIAADAWKVYKANPNLLPTACRREVQESLRKRARLLLTRAAEEAVKDDTESEDNV